MNIRKKLLLASGAAVVATIFAAIVTVYFLARSNRVDELHNLMSSTLRQAEIVRGNMDSLHKGGAIDLKKLAAEARAGGKDLRAGYAQTALYRTIPVVSAWRTVEDFARAEQMEFHTPSHPSIPARNPKNNNGKEFAAAFAAFDRGEDEYFAKDPATGNLILARAVRLSGSCLGCHGSAATSVTADGLDPIGLPMENLKEGSLKGAFVLVAPMRQDAVVGATMKRIAIVGGGILIVVLAVFYLVTQRTIIRPLTGIIGRLREGGEHTSAASNQVAASSQSLAQGATEQAATLEETGASLEEMNSMTRRNAESAEQAAAISGDARSAADRGNQEMTRMSAAIAEIQKGSGEMAKIIRVIDEIAFQTNLLALNAAVEAARAGDAGKGFAVVAQEVRTLANRCAEAARTTAAMIEESVKSAANGVTIASAVGKSLDEITAAATKLNALIADIAAASREQAQGIDQVNKGVSEMEKVTQANAAGAEESAAAAQELSSQANQLAAVVAELGELVGADGGSPATRAESAGTDGPSHARAAHSAVARRISHEDGIADAAPKKARSAAASMIPLDADESRRPAGASSASRNDDFSQFNEAA